MFRSGFVAVWMGLLLAPALAWQPAGAGAGPAEQADAAEVERLRQRVSGYYSALGSGQSGRARQFVLPASREAFAGGQSAKSRIAGFSIVDVTVEEGDRSAVVEVKLEVMAPPMGRFPIDGKFRWKKESGEWFFDPADPPQSNANFFKEYYLDKQAARANPKPGEAPPPLLVEFEKTVHEFEWVLQGTPVRPRFPFHNLSSQDIVVEEVSGPDWLIEDRTEKRRIPAGEAGEIILEVNTSNLRLDIGQDVFVRFEPVKEMVKLRITGRVFTPEDVAKSPSLSKEAAARKAAQPPPPQ